MSDEKKEPSVQEWALNEILQAALNRYESATHDVRQKVAAVSTARAVEEHAMSAYFEIQRAVEKVSAATPPQEGE